MAQRVMPGQLKEVERLVSPLGPETQSEEFQEMMSHKPAHCLEQSAKQGS